MFGKAVRIRYCPATVSDVRETVIATANWREGSHESAVASQETGLAESNK